MLSTCLASVQGAANGGCSSAVVGFGFCPGIDHVSIYEPDVISLVVFEIEVSGATRKTRLECLTY